MQPNQLFIGWLSMTELLLEIMLDADCAILSFQNYAIRQIKMITMHEIKYLSVPLILLVSIKNIACFSGPSHNGSSFSSLISSTLLFQTRFRNCSNAFDFGSYSIVFPGTC